MLCVRGGVTMKNLSLFSVVSVLALTVGTPSLFAADREVPPAEPAPARQEPAPARQEAAPARERAEPARRAARSAQPARAAPAAQATSWTGNQAGGFGGGNISAGNFADPVLHTCAPLVYTGGFAVPGGGPSPVFSSCSPGVPFAFSTNKGGFTGGGFIGSTVQYGNMVYGIEGDVAGKTGESSYVQPSSVTVAYSTPTGGFFPGFSTPTATRNDVISGSVRQGVDGSIRPRIGYLINPWTLIYATGGIAFNHVSASYSYSSTIAYTNLALPTTTYPQVAVDTLAGSGSVDKTLVGGTVGAGVEVIAAYGIKVRLEYRWSGFGGMSFDVPLTRTCAGAGCAAVALPSASGNAHIDIDRIAFHTIRAGIGFGF
jgi:outer membrane immunogenic protein